MLTSIDLAIGQVDEAILLETESSAETDERAHYLLLEATAGISFHNSEPLKALGFETEYLFPDHHFGVGLLWDRETSENHPNLNKSFYAAMISYLATNHLKYTSALGLADLKGRSALFLRGTLGYEVELSSDQTWVLIPQVNVDHLEHEFEWGIVVGLGYQY